MFLFDLLLWGALAPGLPLLLILKQIISAGSEVVEMALIKLRYFSVTSLQNIVGHL